MRLEIGLVWAFRQRANINPLVLIPDVYTHQVIMARPGHKTQVLRRVTGQTRLLFLEQVNISPPLLILVMFIHQKIMVRHGHNRLLLEAELGVPLQFHRTAYL